MILAAMVALALVAAAPAIAQVGQGFSQEDVESGGVEPTFEVSNKGNNVNLCPTGHQAANSGNVQNQQGATQYETEVDDIGFGGSSILFETESEGECVQTIEQAAAAAAPAKAAPPPPPKAEAKAGKAEAKAEAPKAEAKAGKAEAKAEAKAKELPKTGGVAGAASVVGLGAGALLVAGGLIARRIIR